MLLEVCVDSFDSAKTAVENGADRLEVCGPLGNGGGTSPSFALVLSLHKAFPDIPLMVMIRPRPGDFVYSDSELDLMRDEINLLKTLCPPIAGVVLGCLLPSGQVDTDATRSLVERAQPLEVTFHRAFDMVFYPSEHRRGSEEAMLLHGIHAINSIQSIPGIIRILTSALSPSLPPAIHLFTRLHLYLVGKQSISTPSADRFRSNLYLLPGSGLNPVSLTICIPVISDYFLDHEDTLPPNEDAPHLLEALQRLNLKELHASCSSFVEGPVTSEARREGMGMGDWKRWEAVPEVVREMKRLLDGRTR